MKKALDNLVDKLDKVLKQERHDNPNEDVLYGSFMFGRHSVRYCFRETGLTIEIYNPVLDSYLDNVAIHCERCAVLWDGIETEESDIWNCNGFADNSDYLRYKYG